MKNFWSSRSLSCPVSITVLYGVTEKYQCNERRESHHEEDDRDTHPRFEYERDDERIEQRPEVRAEDVGHHLDRSASYRP